MDDSLKFKIAEKRGLKSRKRKRSFLRLKHIMAAAKARKAHEPRLRSVPPVRLTPQGMSGVTMTDIKQPEVKPKIKQSKFKKLCKKVTAMFATKK